MDLAQDRCSGLNFPLAYHGRLEREDGFLDESLVQVVVRGFLLLDVPST